MRRTYGWPTALAQLAAGAATAAGLPPFSLWPLALGGLAVSAILLPDRRRAWRHGAAHGAAFGLGLYAVHLAWLLTLFDAWFGPIAAVPVTSIVLAVPVATTAAAYGAATAFGRRVRVALPFAWVAADALRAVGPFAFPWGYTGYALAATPMIQIADLGGIHLVSLVVLATAGLLATAARRRRPAPALLALAMLGAAFVYGHARLTRPPGGRRVSVSIVQGDIDPFDKALGISASLETYVELSRRARGDLVVWPETAVPTVLNLDAASRQAVRRASAGRTLVMGAFEQRGARLFNDAYLWAEGRLTGTSRKRHLVPGGEWLPLEHALPELYGYFYGLVGLGRPSGLSPGRPRVLPSRWGPIGAYISFESAFPDTPRRLVRHGAVLLAHLSNDAWFGRGPGPAQHLATGRVRAIETRRYVLRASNNGTSAIIDDRGRLVEAVPRFTPTVLNGTARLEGGITPYVRYGDWPVWGSLVALALLAVESVLRRGRREAASAGPDQ